MALLTAQWLGHRSIDATLTLYIQAVAGDIPTDTTADPAYSIYEEETGTAILTGTLAKLDDAGTTGFYSEALTLSAASGFEVDKNYAIRFTATLGLNAQGQMATFRVGPEAADVQRMTAGIITAAVIADGAIDAATFAAGAINAAAIADGAIDAATFAAGAINAAAIADGAIDAATFAAGAINAAAIADGAIDAATFAAGAINAAAIAADAIGASELAADAVTEIRSVVSGTSDSGTTLTMVDAARTEADTDYWKGAVILFTSGTISGQARLITGFNAATDTITFAPATTQAVSTQTYEILPQGGVDLQLWRGSVPNGLNLGRVDVLVGAMDPNVITATVIAAGALDADAFTAAAIGVIADGVWDEDIVAAHGTADTSGEVLSQLTKRAATLTTEVLDGSILGQMLDDGTAVYDRTTDSLQAIRDAIPAAGPSVGAIADAVWDEARAGHVGANTFGEGVASVQGNVTGSVGSVVGNLGGNVVGNVNGNVVGSVGSVVGNLGGNVVGNVNGNVVGSVGSVADPSNIADATWDEDIVAAHGTADTAGEIVSQLTKRAATLGTEVLDGSILGQILDDGTAVYDRTTDSLQAIRDAIPAAGPSAADNANAVWDELTAEARTAGSYGQLIKDDIDATISSRASAAALATVQADTDDIQTRLPATLNGGRMRSHVEAIDAGPLGQIADGVWDEPTAGHNTTGTFGQVLFPIRAGTAQAGAATTITLDVGASAVDDYYNGMLVYWTSGGGDLQARSITDYVGATKVATVSPAWAVNPAAGNAFVILPEPTVTGSTSTPADVADAVWDELRAAHVIAGSFGEGVASVQGNVTGSVGSVTGNVGGNVVGSVGSVALNGITAASLDTSAVNEIVDQTWDEILAGHLAVGSTGEALNNAAAGGSPGAIADAVWDEARAGHVAAGSFGEHVLADVTLISGDATAADNVEAAFETGGANTVTMRLAQLSVVNSGGDAIVASSTGGNGHGVNASGNGSGDGIRGTGGATNDSTGIRGASAATNGYGIQGVGSGTRSGIRGIGGATGHGIHGFGGATSGHGVLGQGNANGSGLRGIGGGTAGNSGIVGESGPTGHGIHGFGDGVGNGILGVGGATGHGAQLAGGATSGHGLAAVGQGAGHGILAQGGATSGIGILARAQANNDRGMSCEANGTGAGLVAAGGTGGGDGLAAVGNGVGAGLRATGGATGDGIRSLGGLTSGDGLHVEAQTAGDGLQAVGAGGGLPYNPAIGTPAENADAVWDEILGGHLGIGSTGEALAAAAAGGATPGAIADAVWDEATSGHLISGTFGQAQNSIRAGTAQGGGATTITLDAGASAVDDFYNFTLIFVTGGTGAGQSRMISDYVGATKVATVNATWGTNPDGTSVFVILPFGSIPGVVAPSAADNANAVWDELTGEGRALGSYGQLLKDDIDATISSRASAAALAVAQADLDNIQTRLPAGLNGGRMSSHVEAMDAAVVNQIVDQTWDEILAGHLNVGSTGEALNDAAAGGGGGGASPAAVADAVWDEAKADHEGATIFGNVGQDLDDLEFTGNEG